MKGYILWTFPTHSCIQLVTHSQSEILHSLEDKRRYLKTTKRMPNKFINYILASAKIKISKLTPT